MTDSKSKIYTVLPLRDIVVFPNMAVTLFVGRSKSIAAISHASEHHENLLLVTQEDETIDDPTTDQLYTVGTEGKINQIITLPDGTIKILVEGVRRHKIEHFTDRGDFIQAHAFPISFKVSSQEIPKLVDLKILI